MNLGIIGLGVVGSANKLGFEKVGHTVSFHDPKYNTNIRNVLNSEIVFICVPTPSTDTGDCDTSILESTIDSLTKLNYSGIIAIRSTSIAGFTQKMIDKYSNDKICFVPEMLRERFAIEDFIENHSVLAVGTLRNDVYEKVLLAHGDLPKNSVMMTPTEAELLKYFNNVYAALRVTFANVFYDVCNKLNCDYDTIKNSYIKTGKAVDMYLNASENLRGYGGMCLPKDTKAFFRLIKNLGLDYTLIESVDKDNSLIKKTVFEGMRLE